MKKAPCKTFLFIIFFLAGLLFPSAAVPALAEIDLTFLYRLSDFNGPVRANWATVRVDETRNEIYVVDAERFDITIYNQKGMLVHRFGDDGRLGVIGDVGVTSAGNILVLSRGTGGMSLLECNFRGDDPTRVDLKNLPPELASFSPSRLVCREGRVYLLDISAMVIVVASEHGVFQKMYDLGSLLEVDEKKKGETEINGFSVDYAGNMLFTVPVLFSAYRLSPDGILSGFGKPGSAPGRFGIVGGIVADKKGNLYVADRLKCVIIVFDKNFQFLKQFGYRGDRPENLIAPYEVAVDPQGNLYVSQLQNRGVSVFKVTND